MGVGSGPLPGGVRRSLLGWVPRLFAPEVRNQSSCYALRRATGSGSTINPRDLEHSFWTEGSVGVSPQGRRSKGGKECVLSVTQWWYTVGDSIRALRHDSFRLYLRQEHDENSKKVTPRIILQIKDSEWSYVCTREWV